MQMQGVEPVTIEVDVDAAAERLAGGVRIPTISNEDRDDFDIEAFEAFHEYLEKTFPNVHHTLQLFTPKSCRDEPTPRNWSNLSP